MNFKKNKKIFIVVTAAVLLVVIFTAVKIWPVKTVVIHGDIADSFHTVDDLKNNSNFIAKIKSTDTNSFEYEGIVFTVTKATVEQVFKGDLKNGDEINILETGGTDNFINYAYEGNEVFQKNQKAYVFLDKYEGPVTENAYVIKGVYQGKFIEGDEGKLKLPKELTGEITEIKSADDLRLSEEQN